MPYKLQEKATKRSKWKDTNRYNSFTGKKMKVSKGTSKTRAILYKKTFQALNRMTPEREFYKLRIVKVKKRTQKRRKK